MSIFDIFRRKRKAKKPIAETRQEQTAPCETAVPALPREPDQNTLHEMLMERLLVTEGSNDIYKALVSELGENCTAGKIASIVMERSDYKAVAPLDVAVELTIDTIAQRFKGMRPEHVVQDVLSSIPNLSQDEALELAQSVNAKASTSLTRIRSERYGRPFYTWDTCGDGDRVRPSHRNLEGVICCWADPPHPEALIGEPDIGAFCPGEAKQCRCTPMIVVDVKDIKFPARVHKQGTIYTADSLAGFLALFGL